MEDFLFDEKLGQTKIQGNGPELAFSNLFAESTARLSTGVKLARYIFSAYENWNNYKPDDNTIARVKENNNEDMGRGFPDNLYEL